MNKKLSISSLSLLAIVSSFSLTSQQAMACGYNAYLGQTCLMATNYCPVGTAKAEGQIISISSNQALFALLGTAYGGNGITTFALPDLRGRAPVHWGTGPGLTLLARGNQYGREYYQQTISNLPSHSHLAAIETTGFKAVGDISIPVTGSAKIASSSDVSGSGTPSQNAVLVSSKIGREDVAIYAPVGTEANVIIGGLNAVTGTATGAVELPVTANSNAVLLANTGGGQAMPIAGPRLAMTYCIVTNGQFPTRD